MIFCGGFPKTLIQEKIKIFKNSFGKKVYNIGHKGFEFFSSPSMKVSKQFCLFSQQLSLELMVITDHTCAEKGSDDIEEKKLAGINFLCLVNWHL